jgi:hypothetical protein
MVFRRGQKVEVYKKSKDESWESYMDEYIGLHGIITDPDATINDPDALVGIHGIARQIEENRPPGLYTHQQS